MLTCLGGKHTFQETQQIFGKPFGQLRGEGEHLFLLSDTKHGNGKLKHSKVMTQNPKIMCGKKVLCFFSFDFWGWDYKTTAALIFSSSSHKYKAGYFYFPWNLTCLLYDVTCRSSENRHHEMIEITKPAALWLFLTPY